MKSKEDVPALGLATKVAKNDVGEGRNHNQQCNPGKDGEENLGSFTDVGFDNLADTLCLYDAKKPPKNRSHARRRRRRRRR